MDLPDHADLETAAPGRALTRGYPAAIRPLSAGCVQRGVTPSVA
ncbi:hypothetical protein I547_4217 [Mycobacterium kansasii 824]|nr:hypothetical protein I547_4217 [Mycobacterium kansasii 824]